LDFTNFKIRSESLFSLDLELVRTVLGLQVTLTKSGGATLVGFGFLTGQSNGASIEVYELIADIFAVLVFNEIKFPMAFDESRVRKSHTSTLANDCWLRNLSE
jgi:hypothetical protein